MFYEDKQQTRYDKKSLKYIRKHIPKPKTKEINNTFLQAKYLRNAQLTNRYGDTYSIEYPL